MMPLMRPELTALPHPDDASHYLAVRARDARFDGHFFFGVTTTGVYCRPVCKVRPPQAAHCRFFALASQAEAAGFRPCLRCRPELAPAPGSRAVWSVQDARTLLALQAAQLLDAPHTWAQGEVSMAGLAARLGVSERHVRRVFEAHWGVSPLQYWQTRRLLTAKQLLTDTVLPVAEVAGISGFGSVRRFHAAFAAHYRLQPLALRKGAAHRDDATGAMVLKAAYRAPLDHTALLEFLAARALPGLEAVDVAGGHYRRSLCVAHGTVQHRGWVHAQFVPTHSEVHLHISPSLAPVLPTVLTRMRCLLDLDADPHAIDAVLAADFPQGAGLRLPGTVDGLELGVRAIVGQQVTVAAARTLLGRLVAHYGKPMESPIDTPWGHISHTFPDAATLAQARGEDLGALGIVRQRQAAIVALARAVQQGTLVLEPGADVPQTLAALQALPGIGEWTAQIITMRALHWPDTFAAADVAVQSALGLRNPLHPHPHPARQALALSQAWRPWRSYAMVGAWAGLYTLSNA